MTYGRLSCLSMIVTPHSSIVHGADTVDRTALVW
jgi:hypothetical protein